MHQTRPRLAQRTSVTQRRVQVPMTCMTPKPTSKPPIRMPKEHPMRQYVARMLKLNISGRGGEAVSMVVIDPRNRPA